MSSRSIVLGKDEVHVWRASLQSELFAIAPIYQVLSEDEKQRAARICSSDRREKFILARGLLRLILSRYLELNPAQLEFKYGDRGKPYLVTPTNLYFNLSHSRNTALYAISQAREVGIDVEYIDRHRNVELIARRFFLPHEQIILEALSEEQKIHTFFRYWTLKEAYAKATGKGLSQCLANFDATVLAFEGWYLSEIILSSEYTAAFAIQGHTWQLKCWDYQLSE
jgi:4'-phosphopantetheinyl transferase